MKAPTHEEQADALETQLAEEDRALLDGLADAVARRGMVTVAILFLDAMKPLGFVAGQSLHFLRPLVASVAARPESWDRAAALLERRGAVELLVRRLEARA